MKRVSSALKWFYPGMRVKRWLVLTPAGVLLVILGVALIINMKIVDFLNLSARIVADYANTDIRLPAVNIPISIILIMGGLLLIFISFRQVIRSITSVISPSSKDRLADVIYQKRYLAQGYRIVVIGGGTGLSTMLRGLKEHSSNIAAVVTVTDDGGSSGVLNKQLGIPPPGDIRNCIVALADEETLMTELLQHRFNGAGEGLGGHSLGNLLIAAMTDITGDFEKAVKETSKVLAIRGNVFPSTSNQVRLCGEMEDGSTLIGETEIAKSPLPIKRIGIIPADAQPLTEVLEAIRLADAIIIGPGSVYTSIIPNLLVQGMVDAILASQAVKIYVCNVMTQPGETNEYKASDHVKAVIDHSNRRLFNYVLVNKEVPSMRLLEKYQKGGAQIVSPDADTIKSMGFKPVTGSFISQTEVVRHDSQKLAEAILKIVYETVS